MRQRYKNDDGLTVAVIASSDLRVGDRIMVTSTKRFTARVTGVVVRDGRQHVTFADGQEADYTLSKRGRWIVDASEAS